MNNDSSFLTEFLAETNLLLAQIDSGNKLYDLFSPVRNLLLKEKELISFSVARYCGSNKRIAFFCEWYYQTLKLTKHTQPLLEENRSFFSKRVPIRLRGIPNLDELVERDIRDFLSQQLSILHTKTKELTNSLVIKNPELEKYLNESYLNNFYVSQYSSKKRLYTEKMTIREYLDSKTYDLSFIKISLPYLLGFRYKFAQPESMIDANNVKWLILEEVLKNISLLHEINSDNEFDSFVYLSDLDERQEFEWLQLPKSKQIQKLLSSNQTREKVEENKQKIYDSALFNLNNLSFPEDGKNILMDLLEWVRSIKK